MCIRTFFQKLYVSKQVYITVPKKQLLIILPFLGKLSSKLKQRVANCFKSSLPQCEVKIIFKSTNRLSSLFTYKDVIPKDLQSNLIYKFIAVTATLPNMAKQNAISRLDCLNIWIYLHLLVNESQIANHQQFLITYFYLVMIVILMISLFLTKANNGFKLLIKESLLYLEILLSLIGMCHPFLCSYLINFL